jgi:protein TonB
MVAMLLLVAALAEAAGSGEAAIRSQSSEEPSAAKPFVAVIPDWRRRATGEDLMRVYPRSAARRGVEGIVMVVCQVTNDGEMDACAVEQEAPPDEGFGEAALKLMPKFLMRPKTKDGSPVGGGAARIPIQFRLPR